MQIKILYVQPIDLLGTMDIMVSLLRVSNYVKSKQKELNSNLQEEYLDLRYEDLPEFIPENIENYRNSLKNLLNNLYQRYNFDVVAISCYGSSNYINVVEVAYVIKYYINPSSIIVVGGAHASICPEDFQPWNFPEYINNAIDKSTTIFDYLIKEEGEIPFFNLIKDYSINVIKKTNSYSRQCVIREIEIINDLNTIPIIDLNLFRKYQKKFNPYSKIWIDFSRGCIFKCRFCINSENYMNCYKKVRTKSIQKCLEELKVIKNANWLPVKEVCISDMIFLPKKSLRENFFYELNKIYNSEGAFPFRIITLDRIELITLSDLENYKKLNCLPHIGLETCSKTMLFRIGKILGKHPEQIQNGIDYYLRKLEEIIKEGNRLNLLIRFNCMMGLPGSTEETIQENRDFFLKKRADGNALAEKYKIILKFNQYIAYIGSDLYKNGEKRFGTKMYYEKWWKLFDKDQSYYSILVDPSKELSFEKSIELHFKFIKEFFQAQSKLKNPTYSLQSLMFFMNFSPEYKLYKKIINENFLKRG